MRSEHLERYFERFKNNLNKQSISYNDIAFMTENEKQYMEFFKKLSANSEIDINEDDVFKAVTETEDSYGGGFRRIRRTRGRSDPGRYSRRTGGRNLG